MLRRLKYCLRNFSVTFCIVLLTHVAGNKSRLRAGYKLKSFSCSFLSFMDSGLVLGNFNKYFLLHASLLLHCFFFFLFYFSVSKKKKKKSVALSPVSIFYTKKKKTQNVLEKFLTNTRKN